MLQCLSFNSSTPSPRNPPLPLPPHSQENSAEEQTPTPSTSPNVSREYDLAVQAPSFNEIRSMIQTPHQSNRFEIQQQDQQQNEDIDIEEDEDEDSHHRNILTRVLQPDPNSVRETLANAKPESTLTRLVSTYFDHSETTSYRCLTLFRIVNRAREMYNPIFDLISVLPTDCSSLSQPQCDTAYDLFVEFNRHENPFIFPHFHTLRNSFSDLKHEIQLDRRKCRHRIRLFRNATIGCGICVLATVSIGVVTAVVVATHAFSIGFAAMVPNCIPFQKRRKRKELARLKQLDAAESGTFVVNHVNTIDSLVDRLQTAVEGDKAYVRFALERGRDRHPIQEVVKQLRKTQPIFEQLLKDLEQHIYLCFNTVNKARDALLKEISLHQTV